MAIWPHFEELAFSGVGEGWEHFFVLMQTRRRVISLDAHAADGGAEEMVFGRIAEQLVVHGTCANL